MQDKSSILIVDDDLNNRETLEMLLQTQGYDLLLAENGTEALQKAVEFQPDLILLDVMMPGMDGYEVCDSLRKIPAVAEIPILMLTAMENQEARLAGFEAGADDYITKPFSSIELFARVRTVTRLNRYRRLLSERARFEQLFHLSPNGHLILKANGSIKIVNHAMIQILGIESEKEILDTPLLDWIHPDWRNDFKQFQEKFFENQNVSSTQTEACLQTRQGELLRAGIVASHIEHGGEKLCQIIFDRLPFDQTSNRLTIVSQRAHRQSIENLGVLAGLLDAQRKRAKGEMNCELKKAELRLRAVILLHECLLESTGPSQVSMKRFLDSIASLVSSTCNHPEIHLRTEITNAHLPYNIALRCGLAASELLCNAYQHAFLAESKGEIELQFSPVAAQEKNSHSDHETWRLVVHDNGSGLPADFSPEKKGALGLQVIQEMARQLEGRLAVIPSQSLPEGKGSTFQLYFNS